MWNKVLDHEAERKRCEYCEQTKWTAPIFSENITPTQVDFANPKWICLNCIRIMKANAEMTIKQICEEQDDFSLPSYVKESIRNGENNAVNMILKLLIALEAKLEIKEMLER